MIPSNNTTVHNCWRDYVPVFPVILIFGIFPFHVLVMKILAKNLHFALPRHSILFSLCLSDGIQVSFSLIAVFIHSLVTFTAEETACQVLSGALMFTYTLTLIVTCAAVIALSVERYIACIHSFRLHQIVTESRIFYGSIGTWVTAVVVALTVLLARHGHYLGMLVNESSVKIVSVICIFPTSVIIIVIQCKLYLLSRKKLRQVTPSQAFGAQLELADYRKKHLKVALVAGIIAFVFVLCMVPFASISLYELMSGSTVSPLLKITFGYIIMANSFFDPFIYGMGMGDIRKKIWQELKNLKEYLVELISSKCGQFVSH